MIPVLLSMEVPHSYGCLGFSYLERPFLNAGEPVRRTLLFLRDTEGHCEGVAIIPAKSLRGL